MDLASTEIHSHPSVMNELIEAGDPRTKVVGKHRPPAAGSDADWTQFNQLQENFTRMWGEAYSVQKESIGLDRKSVV